MSRFSRQRLQGAVFRHVFGNRFPSFLLPSELRLLVQMRRGSSISFITTLSMAYATEYDIPYRWTPNYVLFSKHRHTIPRDDRSVWAIATPLDARSLSFRRAPFYTSHFSSTLSGCGSAKAFVRLRDPYDQFRSHSASLKLQGVAADKADCIAFGYLEDFVNNLESSTIPLTIVRAEHYFEDKFSQLRECFDFFDVAVSNQSISNAVSQYTSFETQWSELPAKPLVDDGKRTARKSYKTKYLPIEADRLDQLDRLVRSTILSDYYSIGA